MATSCVALQDMPKVDRVLSAVREVLRNFTTAAVHAPLEDWFEWILRTGFKLQALREPRPTAEALRHRPDLEDATRVAYYLVFDLRR